MKLLVTGVCGRVGRGVVRALGKHYELRLLDLQQPPAPNEHEYVQGSILDEALVLRAVDGVGGVVHMAIASKATGAPSTDDSFDVNVKGLYKLLEAADAVGVGKFVHVSSTAHVIGHWYAGQNLSVVSSPTTRGRCSLTKALQEQVCEHFSRNSQMRIVALRLWHPCRAEDVYARLGKGEDVYSPGLIDTEDFGEACRAALEADELGRFEIFHCIATPEARKRFDIERTEKLLSWRPKHDFADLAPPEGES